MTGNPIFQRLELLTGPAGLARLAAANVAVFGLGGVGGWAAEGLVRSGVGSLTLVDSDVVDISNINRQIQAHTGNLGRSKAGELEQRLALINPECRLTVREVFYIPENADTFALAGFDYVLDCIDSLASKVDLIRRTCRAGTTVYSSMGAGFKLDPTRVRVDSIWRTEGCPLARRLRRLLREKEFSGDFRTVYSPEQRDLADRSRNASAVQVTAVFGMFLTGLVVNNILDAAAR